MSTETISGYTPREDDRYEDFLVAVAERFQNTEDVCGKKLFLTNIDKRKLYGAYLRSFPADTKQHYTCSACREFIFKYGGVVFVNAEGLLKSAVWPEDHNTPDLFKPFVAAVADLISKAEIVLPFYAEESLLGVPETGPWRHFSVRARNTFTYAGHTAYQAAAEVAEGYRQVSRALTEYSLDTVQEAFRIVESGLVPNAEKITGQVKFLYSLHRTIKDIKDSRRRKNLIWEAVASCPVAFHHIESSMVGVFLADVKAGKSFERIKNSFTAKTESSVYRRPTEAPAQALIDEAEAFIKKMGTRESFRRRYAKLSEVLPHCFWTSEHSEPKTAEPSGNLFAAVKSKDSEQKSTNDVRLPAVTVSWEKFARDVIPKARKISVSMWGGPEPLVVVSTAVDAEGELPPPILQWDAAEKRNPFSWLTRREGLNAGLFGFRGLCVDRYMPVSAVSQLPCHWGGAAPNFAEGVVLYLEDAREAPEGEFSVTLIPEVLKSEYAPFGKVLNAFSNISRLESAGTDTPAVGYAIMKAGSSSAKLRVEEDLGERDYNIDRWE